MTELVELVEQFCAFEQKQRGMEAIENRGEKATATKHGFRSRSQS